MKVLLAVDKSQHAEQAVESVKQCLTGNEVEILHVLDLEANPHPHLSAALIDWYHNKIRSLLSFRRPAGMSVSPFGKGGPRT